MLIYSLAEQIVSMRKLYSFKLVHDFTASLVDHQSIAKFDKITTGIYGAVCGVTLQLNTTYLIKGTLVDEPHIGLCNSYVKALDHVPGENEAKALFEDMYKLDC